AWVAAFVSEVYKKTGVAPIIYTGGPFWRSSIGATTNFDCPLWLAAYVKNPKPYVPGAWKTYTFWQYTSSASVPGVAGGCDVSVLNGDRALLATLVRAAGTASKPR